MKFIFSINFHQLVAESACWMLHNSRGKEMVNKAGGKNCLIYVELSSGG